MVSLMYKRPLRIKLVSLELYPPDLSVPLTLNVHSLIVYIMPQVLKSSLPFRVGSNDPMNQGSMIDSAMLFLSTICGLQDEDAGGVAFEVGHFNNRMVLCECVDYCSHKVSATD